MHLTFSKQSSCQSCFVACVVTVFLICGVLIVPRKPARFVTVHAGACSEKPPWLEQYFLCNAHSLSGRHVWQAPPSISLNNLFTMREPVCPPRLFMHPSETHNPPKPSHIPQNILLLNWESSPTVPGIRLQRNRSLTLLRVPGETCILWEYQLHYTS